MAKRLNTKARKKPSKRRIKELIADATVDCYNESEARVGFLTMIQDRLALPFTTTLLGESVEVVAVDMGDDESITAVCCRGKLRQPVPILDLPIPEPPPEGSEWIDAYRAWLKGAY